MKGKAMSPDNNRSHISKEIALSSLYREILKQRGWVIKEITKEEAKLIPVETDGAVGCIDGRKVKRISGQSEEITQRYERGPKVPGGVIGIALSIVKDGTLAGIQKASTIILESGYVPGGHDIPENHCGAKKLAADGKYNNLGFPTLETDAQSIQSTIKEMQGIPVSLEGEHQEKGMIVNINPAYTRVPDGEYFQADIGYLTSLGMKPEEAITFFATTVEELKGDAKIAYFMTN